MDGYPQIVYFKPFITRANIEIGDFIDVSIEGTNLVANIDLAEAEKRPDYVAD